MKVALAVSAMLLLTVLTGCATMKGGGVWPVQDDPNEYYWHVPQRLASPDEASGAIKNMQGYFVEWAGWDISTLDIDRYGLRASGTWTEKSSQWVPSNSGFFAGWTYVPVYGGSVQTNSEQRQASFAIPFDEVANLRLCRFPTISKEYKWGIIVKYKGERPTLLLRVRSKEEATRLISALETLAAERGYEISYNIGLYAQPLTAAQSAELGLQNGSGLLLTIVLKDSPTEKAGLRSGDVVTAIGKEQIRELKDFGNAHPGRNNWNLFRRERENGPYRPVSLEIDFPKDPGSTETPATHEDYWFKPTKMASAEQAVGTIKNLQQDIVGFSGWRIDTLEVDRFGMRAKGKDALLIIPFDEVSKIIVGRYLSQKNYEWGLSVYFSTERQPVILRTANEKVARRLGDAIGTLAMEQGSRVRAGAGITLQNLTDGQREAAGLGNGSGVMILGVFVGGPAEKFGIRRSDIIIEAGGTRLSTYTELIQIISKAETETRPLTLKLLRLEGEMRKEHLVTLHFDN